MKSSRGQLALIALVQVLAMALWFSASAVIAPLREDWSISAEGAGWLTTSVQCGFVVGALLSALLNIADRVPPHVLLAAAAVAGAIANASVVVFSSGLDSAIPLRFLTGLALAGVYPVGMKLMTTWFHADRSFALGVLVAALTLGSAMPHLFSGWSSLSWKPVLVASSVLALVSAVVAASLIRPGPYASPSAPISPGYALNLFRDRQSRLINFGYFGHMWELYAMWAWLPSFVAASLAAWRTSADRPVAVAVISFVAIGMCGAVGCVCGGRLGVRHGAIPVARYAMLISGACCLLSAAVFGAHPVLLVSLLMIWGVTIIADSAQFSTALSHVVDPRYVGTALTIQTAVGFALTVVTIQGLPYVVDLTGWRFAFVVLSIGPLLGATSMGLAKRRTPTDDAPSAPS